MNEPLYGFGESERLFGSLDELLEEWVNQLQDDATFDEAASNEEWPMKIRVFRRMNHWRSRHSVAYRALDRLLEDLDEKYGDPEGDPTEPSDAMKRAALAFADAILKDYSPYMCEPTGEIVEITKQQAEEAWP